MGLYRNRSAWVYIVGFRKWPITVVHAHREGGAWRQSELSWKGHCIVGSKQGGGIHACYRDKPLSYPAGATRETTAFELRPQPSIFDQAKIEGAGQSSKASRPIKCLHSCRSGAPTEDIEAPLWRNLAFFWACCWSWRAPATVARAASARPASTSHPPGGQTPAAPRTACCNLSCSHGSGSFPASSRAVCWCC